MRPLMPKLIRSRTFHFALGVAWLPYILMRCQDSTVAHEDCEVMRIHAEAGPQEGKPSAHHHHAAAQDHDAAGHRGVDSGQARHEHDSRPVHTCCQATGKYNVTVASITSFAPPILIATLLGPGASIGWQRVAYWSSRAVPVAHGPPSYLLHSTLLI